MTAGFQMGDALTEVAPLYPNATFGGVDVDFAECIPNVREILFAEEQATYLLGVLTASMLEMESHPIYETNKALSIVAGVEQPAVNRFVTGYIAGARSVSPDVPIYVYYTGTWQNPDLFREAAIAAYNQGAGSVFEIGGVAGLSIIEAAKEYGFLEMTTDQDKNDLAPDHVLSSAMKDLTQATYLTVQDAVEGNWSGCEARYDLSNGGVKIAPFHGLSQYVPQEVTDRIAEAEAAIVSGEIVVPQTLEEGADLLDGVEFERPAE
jgi:basic membrane protein A